ncbi:MAG: hypothetical protein K2H43_06515, partial [Clostridia bacterium]|nr:hypothetical protein [Clostridia bacterium]
MKILKRSKRNLMIATGALSVAIFVGAGIGLQSFPSNAYTAATLPGSIGSLTYSDYDTRTDGKVFDGDVLGKLYDKIVTAYNLQQPDGQDATGAGTYSKAYEAVKNSHSTITGSTYGHANDDWTQPYSMDFAALSGGTEGSNGTKTDAPNPVTVEFAGFTWNVVYLTTNTTGSTNGNGDLIATLWMSDVAKNASGTKITSKYSSFASTDTTATNTYYYSNIYSTSLIRVQTLNGGGDAGAKYATSTSVRTTAQTNRESNVFAPLTLSGSTAIGQKSLTDYLVQPKNMLYQEEENHVWANTSAAGEVHLMPNEAWGTPDTTVRNYDNKGGWLNRNGYVSNVADPSKRVYATYLEWAEDYLWLPSLTEVGYINNVRNNNEKGASLWGIPQGHDITKSSDSYWTRTGAWHNIGQCYSFNATGYVINALDSNNGPTTSLAIRPALHLNLTKAQEETEQNGDVAIPQPQDVNLTYNGANHWGLTTILPVWVDTGLHANNSLVQVKSVVYNNTVTLDPADYTTKIKDAGTYKVTLKIADSKHINSGGIYKWRDTTDQEVSFNIVIAKKKLTVLTFSDADGDNIPDSFTYDTSQLCSGDSIASTDLSVKYGASNITSAAAASTAVPTSPGTYNAIAVITHNNYEVDATGTSHYQSFIVKAGVAEPYFASGAAGTISVTAQYTGSAIDFVLGGFQGIVDGDVTFVPINSTGIAYNSTDKKLVVTGGVGTYTAKATLNDPSTKQWQSGG